MDLVIEIVGWTAAGVLLGAYALLSRGKLSGQESSFQTLNVVGSLLVGVNSFVHEAWPSVSVNVVWLVIGVATLAARHRRRDHATTSELATEPTAPSANRDDASRDDASRDDASRDDAGRDARATGCRPEPAGRR